MEISSTMFRPNGALQRAHAFCGPLKEFVGFNFYLDMNLVNCTIYGTTKGDIS
jgi:hypothetical protein